MQNIKQWLASELPEDTPFIKRDVASHTKLHEIGPIPFISPRDVCPLVCGAFSRARRVGTPRGGAVVATDPLMNGGVCLGPTVDVACYAPSVRSRSVFPRPSDIVIGPTLDRAIHPAITRQGLECGPAVNATLRHFLGAATLIARRGTKKILAKLDKSSLAIKPFSAKGAVAKTTPAPESGKALFGAELAPAPLCRVLTGEKLYPALDALLIHPVPSL